MRRLNNFELFLFVPKTLSAFFKTKISFRSVHVSNFLSVLKTSTLTEFDHLYETQRSRVFGQPSRITVFTSID